MTEFHMTEFHMTEFHMTEFHITEFHMTEFHMTGSLPDHKSWLAGMPVLADWVVVPLMAALASM